MSFFRIFAAGAAALFMMMSAPSAMADQLPASQAGDTTISMGIQRNGYVPQAPDAAGSTILLSKRSVGTAIVDHNFGWGVHMQLHATGGGTGEYLGYALAIEKPVTSMLDCSAAIAWFDTRPLMDARGSATYAEATCGKMYGLTNTLDIGWNVSAAKYWHSLDETSYRGQAKVVWWPVDHLRLEGSAGYQNEHIVLVKSLFEPNVNTIPWGVSAMLVYPNWPILRIRANGYRDRGNDAKLFDHASVVGADIIVRF